MYKPSTLQIVPHCHLLFALPFPRAYVPRASVPRVYASRRRCCLCPQGCIGCVEGASCSWDGPISSTSSSKVACVPQNELCPAEATPEAVEVPMTGVLWVRSCMSLCTKVLQPRRLAARHSHFTILCIWKFSKCTHINYMLMLPLWTIVNLLQGRCLVCSRQHLVVEIPRCRPRFAWLCCPANNESKQLVAICNPIMLMIVI